CGVLSISSTTITGNQQTGTGGGGGIYNSVNPGIQDSLTITDTTISYNGGSAGGGIDKHGTGVSITNNNIYGNPLAGSGGFDLHSVTKNPPTATLGTGPIMYEGTSQISAMIPYNGGVLTAFTDLGFGIHTLNRIRWSPDGTNLGTGAIVYEGISPVTAMIP